EGIYRVVLINTRQLTQFVDEAWGHEDSIFLGALILLVLAQHVVGAPSWQRRLGSLLAPIALFTLLASQRRAGPITLVVAFLAFSLVFLVTHRKAFLLVTVPLLLGMMIYLPLFWNNTSLLGQPARSVRSLVQPNARDAAS